jgi:DNA (cytosine-5)-methyltransferase 1
LTGLVVDLSGESWSERPSGLLVPSVERRPTAVDLFCGCGGFSLGIIEAGFDVLCGVDWDCDAAHTYLVNLGAYPLDLRFVEPSDRDRFAKKLTGGRLANPKAAVQPLQVSGSARRTGDGVPVFWLGDVRKLSGEQILDSIGLERGELDLVVGGPPCQGFSIGGRRNVVDPRNSLVFEFARLVLEMRPRAMCMENVPGMLSMTTPTGAPVVDELCRILEQGEFGSFEAMRSVLAGDRKVLSRGAGQATRKSQKKDHDEPENSQRELFSAGGSR